MLRSTTLFVALLHLSLPCIAPSVSFSQVLITGRVVQGGPRESGPGAGASAAGVAGGARVLFGGILCFASLSGPIGEARSFRTWEADPVGWYRISGSAGNYTLVFSTPAHYMRPVVLTNLFLRDGDRIDRSVSPRLDYEVFFEKTWDEMRASGYFQPFVARGTSVTQVGFKLATDGVDGAGPAGQNILVSIHRRGPQKQESARSFEDQGTPDTWEPVGPGAVALNVDCGGPKNQAYSVGWCSGEVPTAPGETYAVHLRAEACGGTFQAYWKPRGEGPFVGPAGCYRLGPAGKTGYTGCDLWMAVATDSDGLQIPYQKRVHRQFVEFAGFRSKWSQTYVALGRGLASVILYAAVGGTQPPLYRQRVRVRIRQDGPEGKIVGTEKIGVGSGNYTGDASWGVLGAVFAPGEVMLASGRTYAVEFESIESYETLHGFVNLKGQESDDRPGFNPYRKVAPDAYPNGTAFASGKDAVDFDLDLQIVEYVAAFAGSPGSEGAPGNPEIPPVSRWWQRAVDSKSLLENGDMEAGDFRPDEPEAGAPAAWRKFCLDPGTVHGYVLEAPEGKNRLIRVAATPAGTADGGYVGRAAGLSHAETFRLSGRLRCSWPAEVDRSCAIGYDPSGQNSDPGAATIVWAVLPPIHGAFVAYESEPIRPAKDAISVWLRARNGVPTLWPFRADFDDFSLKRVLTEPPVAK